MENEIEKAVKEAMATSRGSHDWDHTMRVYNLSVHIANKEGADLRTVRIAALLHDISREEQDKSNGKICHAERGAERAREILKNLDAGAELTEAVCHCIAAHRFRGSNKPETKEAKVLYDADKLDSIGAVGIGRAFHFSGEIGSRLHDKNIDVEKTESYSREDTAYREYLVKLRHVKERMMTAEGKRIAEERHRFMEEFFSRLNKEVEGEL